MRLFRIPASLFFTIVLLFARLHDAGAETPGQPGTDPATTSGPVSAESSSKQSPSAPDIPRAQTTGSGTGTAETGTLPAHHPDMSLTPPVHFTGPEPVMTPGAPAEEQKPKQVWKISKGPQLGPQVDPCETLSVAGETWMDQVHDFVQDNACEPAVWFDTFFVKDHVLIDLRPGTLITLRNSARWTEGNNAEYVGDYRLQLELPQWNKLLKKWRLNIESRSVADKYATQPGQPIQPGVDRKTGVRKSNVGVQADLYTRLRALLRIDSGVNVSIHPDAFIRMRYQYLRPFSDIYLVRYTEIAMWQAVEHFTNTMQLDLERKITTFTFVRWGNNMTHTEGTQGITWNTGVSLFTQLTPKSAISYDTSMWGTNYPGWATGNYRIGSLYRRNFFRPWLFFDLSPEITLPKDAGGKRNSVYAFMATLEMQFGK